MSQAFGFQSGALTFEMQNTKESVRDTYWRSEDAKNLLWNEEGEINAYSKNGCRKENDMNLKADAVQEAYTKSGDNNTKSIGEDSGAAASFLDEADMIHIHLLQILMHIMQKIGGKQWESFSKNIMNEMNSISGGNTGLYMASSSYSLVSYEAESMQFQGTGRALTQDGRTIDFDLRLGMSREYMEYAQIETERMSGLLLDPLVINVGSDVTKISNQSFYFDLDADGKKENVRELCTGSGFLAVDKNGDGTINDGSELFGAATGDGFGELRRYDEDGNGWIDENDTNSWKVLKVWIKDDIGNDRILSLKEADVGAIYLGEAATRYSDIGISGEQNGVIRSTGIYLKESSGEARTVQHIDLAVEA